MMQIRELFGMKYKSIELEHSVNTPMSEVLYALADYVANHGDAGIITGIYTQSDPDDEDQFLTNLVWAI